MKIFSSFLLVIFFTSNLLSQEFDEKYLESLPENIREDIVNQAKERDELEKPVYRNDSSKVNKEDYKQDDKEDDSSKIVWRDFFSTFQSSYMPINEPNFDSEYVLDYGDVLKIQLLGQEDSIDEYQISREGFINIPVAGRLSISGMSLADASLLIQKKIEESYIGTKAFTSIENMRDINVLVTGNAFQPGIYTLSGNSNALQAIVVAGGINEFGSYRDIKVKRNNKIIQIIDVYEYLIFWEMLKTY